MTEILASLIAFQRRFPDDDACGHGHGWELKTRPHGFECARCHRQASVAAGTLLHRTRLSLEIWFRAACLMATHCNGISALQLQKQLGLGSCRSAWMLAAKLRRAMINPSAARCPVWSRSTRPACRNATRARRRGRGVGRVLIKGKGILFSALM